MALAQCHYLLSAMSTDQPLPPLPYPCTRPTEARYEIGPAGLYPVWPADPHASIQASRFSQSLDSNGAQHLWLQRDLSSGSGGLPARHPFPSALRELTPARWWPNHQMPIPGGYYCARLRAAQLATLSQRSLLRPREEPRQFRPSREPPPITHWSMQHPLWCSLGVTDQPSPAPLTPAPQPLPEPTPQLGPPQLPCPTLPSRAVQSTSSPPWAQRLRGTIAEARRELTLMTTQDSPALTDPYHPFSLTQQRVSRSRSPRRPRGHLGPPAPPA